MKKPTQRSSSAPPEKIPPQLSSAEGSDQTPSADSCPVAGFGASAGGLEAFTEVLRRLPPDTGLAIVFIQHLDPDHASVLTDLLARSTRMPVTQVTDGMRVEPNRVHVIPPNKNITISQGTLRLQAREARTPHMPIDHFFRSLASEQGSRAAAVVLSGTASDGTLGLKAIKAEGGITFAQSPESAKYDGMPRSAVAAGCVDFVLPPAGIADELARLCRHPYLNRARPSEIPPDTERDFNEIFAMLRSATGVDFSYYKPGTVRRRTLRRMLVNRLETPEQYVAFLKEHRQELELLFYDLLINVTGFFREPDTFEAIRAKLLPALLKGRAPEDVFRVWVPGCSTGEEAYSIAICLLEYMREARIEVPLQIFGTDLSEAVLQKARAGVYPESIVGDVSPERLRRFFVRSDGGYQIARSVRDVCVFARQNVTKDPPFSKLDLITCRNLLIYLGPVLQAKVMRLFHYGLKHTGFLVLGASEHLGSVGETCFEAVDKQHRIYARKLTPASVVTDFDGYEDQQAARMPPLRPPVQQPLLETHAAVDRMILARYSPSAVVVDRALNILQFRGDTSAYLGHASGEASLDLIKLTRGGLGPEIRRLTEKAAETATPGLSDVLTVALEGAIRNIRISVTPVQGASEEQFLVVFELVAPAKPERSKAKPKGAKAEGERIHELEQELASTRQYLQSVIEEQEAGTEELKSAHEEVQSSNEELQSTNEELLTAKEELQSTNEELTTVNEEMQSRNTELQQINNDLINLLSSVNIPIVMLGNDLRIRRFTPQAEKMLNLLPADVGRPINDFRLKINIPDLVTLCQEVVDTLAAKEREVQDSDGRVYSMWIRPYRTSDNRIDGVVLALVDVTERKRAVEARYRRLFEAAKDGIIIADAVSGEIIDSNPFVTKLLGHSRARLVGVKFWETDLFSGTEIDESLLPELKERESSQKTVSVLAESCDRVSVDIVASVYAEGERSVVQFNIRDISARRKTEEQAQRNDEQSRQAQKLEAVGRLASGVAHDFNNILTAILGYTSLLEEDLGKTHRSRGLVAQVRHGAERAISLTRQLLAFGRKQIVAPERIDPNSIIREMQQMVRVMLSENTEIELSLDPAVGHLRIDRTQLEQILLNLTLNARDAMPDGGTLSIATSNLDVNTEFAERHPVVPIGSYVAFTVKDNGTGMDEETRAHVFEPFFTTKPKGSGSGLGLSTVYNIVKQNGGCVWAYSELGVGSTFTVYLPRVNGEAEPTEQVPELLNGHGTETILVAEDEPVVRSLIRDLLESRGYRVLDAPNGPEAIRLSREHAGPIHLLIADVVMPRMSGRELAFQLAPVRTDMKVLYMSGHANDAILHHGVLEQGLSFIPKPFTREALIGRVRELLDGDGAPKRPSKEQQ